MRLSGCLLAILVVVQCSQVSCSRPFRLERPLAPDAPVGKTTAGPVQALKPFAQEVPGTAFRFDLVPVPASADGKIKPFWIGKTELTWEAFDAFVYRLDEGGTPDSPPATPSGTGADATTRPSKPYLPPDRGFGHEGFAAISLSHKNATEFCKWLSRKTGKRFRLPTESEWEHACRAGSAGAYSWGDDAAAAGEFAWFVATADGQPHPVAGKKPNAWGLYDMHGNVQEWVDGTDGKPVTKGGSYRDAAEKLKITANESQTRAWNSSDPQVPKSSWWLSDGPFVGFRVVCESSDQPASGGEAAKPENKPATPPAGEKK